MGNNYYWLNREERLAYAREYLSNPEKRERSRERSREYDSKPENKAARASQWQKRMQERLTWLAKLKNKPCGDCGQKFPAKAMDFHHLGKHLEGRVSDLVRRKDYQNLIMKEIETCVLLCAVCHRLRD